MNDEQGYNGWANYPTWAVNLWLANDEPLYRAALEIAREEYDDAPHCLQVREETWTLGDARRFNLADHYREWVEEMHADEDVSASLGTDLLGWALEQVDWDEIAAHWLGDLAELREYERQV